MEPRSCKLEDCEADVVARGMCAEHYREIRLSGSNDDRRIRTQTADGTRLIPRCSIEGCSRPVRHKGWCNTHWVQWQRTGSPHALKNPRGTPEERFWRKVDEEGKGGCWLWNGALVHEYGVFDGEPAHRFAYKLLVGPIPEGLHLDHVYDRGCRHKNCVNPAHLEPVTQAENNRRAWAVRRLRESA